eukprot:SAG22_NODE_1260_length_4978_cov_36.695269_3_plen_95_part_00
MRLAVAVQILAAGLLLAGAQGQNVDVVEGLAHMTFEGEDWYLVRRDHDPDGWHRANDQLAGTEEYGPPPTAAQGRRSRCRSARRSPSTCWPPET